MKLSSIKKSVADGAGITGQTLIYDSAVSTGSNTFLPVGLYGDSIEGTYAFTTNQDKLYLHTGQGWFNVAIVNTNPTFTTSPAGSYELATDATAYLNGTATTITLAATDPEGMPITWGYSANTAMNNIAHISNDSSVYTIEPKTQDSAGSATPGAGTLTFTASDGINIASAASTFTLTFDTTVANSEGTTLMLRGVGDSTTNNANVDDVSDTNNSVTVNGNPYIGHFSPYNSAGYSLYAANGNSYLTVAGHSDFAFGTGDFTIEFWYYTTQASNWPAGTHPFDFRGNSSVDNNQNMRMFIGFGSGTVTLRAAAGTRIQSDYEITRYKWHHIAISRQSGSTRMFINGDTQSTTYSDTNNYTGEDFRIGHRTEQSTTDYGLYGYMLDFRIVKGTAVYTTDFIPPTEPLTAISGTTFLLGARSIIRDSSSNQHAITRNGTPEMIPFTPYKHQVYNASEYGGSIYMDGNGDKLTSTGAELLSIGSTSAAFTIETWIYISAFPTHSVAIFARASGDTSNVFAIDFDGSGHIKLMLGGGYAGSDVKAQHNSVLKLKTWHHVALVRASATDTKLFVDGKVSTDTGNNTVYSTDWTIAAGTTAYIGTSHYSGGGASTRTLNGFMSDLRIVKGAAVYTGNFTPPTGPLTKTGGTYPSSTNVSNPTASQTKLLMNFTNGDIIDLSGTSNIKPNGNAQSDTGVQKYGVPSVLFDGTGDFLSIPYSDLYAPGAENYTAECWIYTATDNQTQPLLMGLWNGNSAYSWALQLGAGTNMYPRFLFWDGSSYNDNPATTKITISAWNHIAVVRNHNIFTLFLNGVSVKTATITGTAATVNTPLTIGAQSSGGQPFTGNISDARFTKGLARYPFIPLKETLTTSTSVQDGITCTASNVKLLALTTATITADASAENHTITNVNSTAASTYGPGEGMRSALFAVASDNKLTIPDGEWKTLGSTFTFEAWVYPNSLPHSSHNYIFGDFNSAGANASNSLSLAMASDGLRVLGQSGGSDFTLHASTTVALNQWYHVAVVRNSGNFYIFLDGTMVLEETTKTGTLTNSSQVFAIGGTGAFTTLQWDGYISNFRFNNAQALYTKNFTVPSAALTG